MKNLREIKEEEINRNYTFSHWICGGRKVIDTLNTCNLRELRLSWTENESKAESYTYFIHKTKWRIDSIVVVGDGGAVAAALCIGSKSQFKLRPCLFRHTNTFTFICLYTAAERKDEDNARRKRINREGHAYWQAMNFVHKRLRLQWIPSN